MDDVDIANELVEHVVQQSIKAITSSFDDCGDGNCIDCDIAIPEARLKAVPHALRCIDCQEVEERRY